MNNQTTAEENGSVDQEYYDEEIQDEELAFVYMASNVTDDLAPLDDIDGYLDGSEDTDGSRLYGGNVADGSEWKGIPLDEPNGTTNEYHHDGLGSIDDFVGLENEEEGLYIEEDIEEEIEELSYMAWTSGYRLGIVALVGIIMTLWWVRSRGSHRRENYMSPTQFDDGRRMPSMHNYV